MDNRFVGSIDDLTFDSAEDPELGHKQKLEQMDVQHKQKLEILNHQSAESLASRQAIAAEEARKKHLHAKRVNHYLNNVAKGDPANVHVDRPIAVQSKPVKRKKMTDIEKDDHGGHLVESDGDKHLPTTKNGKPDHRLMGAAWAALHGGYRGNKYEGPDKGKAIEKLKAMYEREGMTPPSEDEVSKAQGRVPKGQPGGGQFAAATGEYHTGGSRSKDGVPQRPLGETRMKTNEHGLPSGYYGFGDGILSKYADRIQHHVDSAVKGHVTHAQAFHNLHGEMKRKMHGGLSDDLNDYYEQSLKYLSHHGNVGASIHNEGGSVRVRVKKREPVDLFVPIMKTDDEHRMVYGFATVSEKDGEPYFDNQGDHVSVDELRKAWRDYVASDRTGGVNHETMDGGNVVEGLVIDDSVAKALTEALTKGYRGLFIGYHAKSDEAWQGVKKGDLTGFSIGGRGKRREVEED